MDTDRVARLLDMALELPPERRAQYIGDACGDDPKLLECLLILLRHHDDGQFLERSLIKPDPKTMAELGTHPDPRDRTIGPYRILAKIGEGGMSRVYLARNDEDPGQNEVALKILCSSSATWRFEDERKALRSLEHPSIPRLLDSGESRDGEHYLVMEHVDGLPITDYCDINRRSIEARLRLMIEVCHAVHHAHQRLIVHRDLKPNNVLVDVRGRPSLLDFGIAKHVQIADQTQRMTTSASLILTPAYAAPEHLFGERITTATDVYSLGVLLFELLVGRTPRHWAGMSRSEIQQQWKWKEPESPSQHLRRLAGSDPSALEATSAQRNLRGHALIRKVGGDLDNIALKAIRYEPDRRYDSVPALIQDLRNHLDGLPVHARPSTFGYRAVKWLRRNAFKTANIAAVLAILIFTAIQSSVNARQLGKERDRAEAQRELAEQERHRAKELLAVLVDSLRTVDTTVGFGHQPSTGEVLDHAIAWSRNDPPEDPIARAELFQMLATICFSLARHEQAADLFAQAETLRAETLGLDHPHTLDSLTSLSEINLRRGRPELARQQTEEALQRIALCRPEDDPDIAESLIRMGRVLTSQGQFDQALQLAHRALDAFQHTEPQPTLHTAAALQALTAIHYRRGALHDAAATGRQALALCREAYSDRDAALGFVAGNLGVVEMALGHFDRAANLFEEALRIHRSSFPANHPSISTDLNNLAFLKMEVQDVHNAEPYFRQALSLTRSHFGDNHPKVAFARVSLGTCLMMGLRFDEAESLLLQAVEYRRNLDAQPDAELSGYLDTLGTCYFLAGDTEAAEPILREALAIRMELFGARGFLTGQSQTILARLYHRMGDVDRADRLYELARASFIESTGPNHWLTQLVDLRRAEIAVDRGYAERGEIMARRAMRGLKEGLTPDHWRVAEARSIVGICLAAQGNYIDAEVELIAAFHGVCQAWGEPSLPAREVRRRLELLYQIWPAPEESRAKQKSLAESFCRRDDSP